MAADGENVKVDRIGVSRLATGELSQSETLLRLQVPQMSMLRIDYPVGASDSLCHSYIGSGQHSLKSPGQSGWLDV